MNSRVNQDVAAGLMFMAFGVVGLFVAKDYPIGSALRMGAGYVPNGLCWLMVILGAFVGGKGLIAGGEALAAWAWRPLIIISVAILAFAFLIESAGLVVATVALVCISASAGSDRRWKEIAIVAVVLATGSVLMFAKGLGLPMKIWPGA